MVLNLEEKGNFTIPGSNLRLDQQFFYLEVSYYM